MNLLSNALKFTAEGHVALNVCRRSNSLGEPHLIFAISDSGIGIRNEALSQLFDSFAQGDSSTTRRYGGSGLGLAISKELVEMMAGASRCRAPRARAPASPSTCPCRKAPRKTTNCCACSRARPPCSPPSTASASTP